MTNAKASEQKRQHVLDTSFVLFSRYGYKRTTVDDVALAAGIAKGSVYLLFASKEAIFKAVCTQMAARMSEAIHAAVAKETDAFETIAAILQAKFGAAYAVLSASPHANELLGIQGELSRDVFLEVDAHCVAELRAALKRARLDLKPLGLSFEAAARLLFKSAKSVEAADERGVLPTLAEHQANMRLMVRVVLKGFGYPAT